MDKDLRRLEQDLEKASPFSQWDYITGVTFPSGAGSDLDIRHNLRTTDSEAIDYHIVRADRATSLYHDQSGTRRPWGTGYIVLRSSVASAVVDLLLTIRR